MIPVYLALLIFAVPVVTILYYPIALLFLRALGDTTLVKLLSIIPWEVVLFTYSQALVSSIGSVLIGSFLAVFFHETDFWGKRYLARICEITFFLPSILVVLSLVGVWGSRGWLGRWGLGQSLYGWPGILLAHVFFNFSLVFKTVGQALSEIDRTEEKVALSLGASRWYVFFNVTWVKLRSAVLQSSILVFLFCSSSFLIILMLGGGPRFNSLETAIYQAVKIDLDIPVAVSLAVLQLVVCFVVQLAYKPKAVFSKVSQGSAQWKLFPQQKSFIRWALVVLVWLTIFSQVILPLMNLTLSGMKGLTTCNWIDLGMAILRSLDLGIRVALVSTLISFCAAYGVRHSNHSFLNAMVHFTCTLPIALSTMVLGLAITIAFSQADWLRETWWAVVCVQSLSVLPMGFRIFNESFSRIEVEIYRTLESLGAKKHLQLFYFEFPYLKRTLALVLVTGLGVSLGESGAVMLFESQAKTTLPLWLFKLMGKYQFEEAQAVGVVLLALTLIIFGLREKWQSSN